MSAWSPLLKARTVLLSAAMLVVAGLVPVLYFVALVVWQISALFQVGSWVPLPAMLLFTDHSLLQTGKAAPVLAFIPEFQWVWTTNRVVAWILGQMHAGLVPGLFGLAAMALGALNVLRQKNVIRAQKQRTEDRLRRVQDYRREDRAYAVDGRREPFISSRPVE